MQQVLTITERINDNATRQVQTVMLACGCKVERALPKKSMKPQYQPPRPQRMKCKTHG